MLPPKRRVRGYQHLSASGHLSSLLEEDDVFAKIEEGIRETRKLFDFLDDNISLLNPNHSSSISLEEWLTLKETVTDYLEKHITIERSQVLFVLTLLRGIHELRRTFRVTTISKVQELAGEQDPLTYWFHESPSSVWLKHILEMIFLGRQYRNDSQFFQQNLWAVAGRVLQHIMIPYYKIGKKIDEHGWWEYFVRQGYVTPLCHIRHPYDATHAEEWRMEILNSILENLDAQSTL